MNGFCDVWADSYVLTQESLSAQAGNTTYTTDHPFQTESLQVYVNGLKYRWGIDFTVLTPMTFEFNSVSVTSDDDVDVIYLAL